MAKIRAFLHRSSVTGTGNTVRSSENKPKHLSFGEFNLNIFYLYAVILVISSVFLLAVCCIFAVNFTPDFFLVQESGLSLSLEHSLAVQAGLKRVLPLWSSCFS